MQEKILKDGKNKYRINEKEFFNCISEGEKFKTTFYSCERNRNAGYVTYKQEFLYKLDEKFIKDNKAKLLRLKIIEKIDV